MNIRATLFALFAFLGFSASSLASDVTHSTPAVQGYDVVSYYEGKRPVRGNGHYVATYEGVTYQFSSEANRKTFAANPEKYVPAYGGYCAFGVSVGKKFIGDPEVWGIVDGKLYLNLDERIQEKWLDDVPGQIKKANKNWRSIRDKSPASL